MRLESLVAERTEAEHAAESAPPPRRSAGSPRPGPSRAGCGPGCGFPGGRRHRRPRAGARSLEADEASEVEAARVRHEQRRRRERAQALATRRRDLAVRTAGVDERAAVLEQRLADVQGRLAAGARAQADGWPHRAHRALVASGRTPGRPRGPSPPHGGAAPHRTARAAATAAGRGPSGDGASRAAAHREGGRGAALAEVGERQRRCEISEAEVRTRLEAAVEHVRHDLDTEPAAAMATEQPPLPDGITARRGCGTWSADPPDGTHQPVGAGGVHRPAGAPRLPRTAARGRPLDPARSAA